eukprot:gene16097-biopygen9300
MTVRKKARKEGRKKERKSPSPVGRKAERKKQTEQGRDAEPPVLIPARPGRLRVAEVEVRRLLVRGALPARGGVPPAPPPLPHRRKWR